MICLVGKCLSRRREAEIRRRRRFDRDPDPSLRNLVVGKTNLIPLLLRNQTNLPQPKRQRQIQPKMYLAQSSPQASYPTPLSLRTKQSMPPRLYLSSPRDGHKGPSLTIHPEYSKNAPIPCITRPSYKSNSEVERRHRNLQSCV